MVFYLTGISFPNGGMASGNRVRHLCRALSKSGVPVRVLTPFSDTGKRERLIIDGISFESLCNRSDNRYLRHLAIWTVYPLRVLRIVYKARRDHRVLLYSYVSSVVMMTIHWIISIITRSSIAAEECEYPFSVLLHQSRIKQWYESRLVPLFYDGIICISKTLQEYFRLRIRKSCKSIYIPMTVDCNLFKPAPENRVFDFDYIAYTGSMRREGGGVDVLVKAFSLIANKYPELHLVLIGKGDRKLEEALLSICGLRDRIHFLFTGVIPVSEMPHYIVNAKILATLPLPTKQQEGCFPTKLGEYLASGVPTVISMVGNPVHYLTDHENVYFVLPNDPEGTARVFDEILTDYAMAQKIGKTGQMFARQTFHYANFSRKLAGWYDEIVNRRCD